MKRKIPARQSGRLNFVHIFADAENQHLGKDHCIIANYIAEMYNASAFLVTENWGQHFDLNHTVVPKLEIISISGLKRSKPSYIEMLIDQLIFIIRNSKNIDVLYTCHFSTRAKLSALIYKFLNKNGYVWIKTDVSTYGVKEQYFNSIKSGLLPKVKIALNRLALYSVDLLTAESFEATEWIKKTYPHESKKIHRVPNPINTPLIERLGVRAGLHLGKENSIITVARIGSTQKNNELMLAALDGLQMNGWTFTFVGPIESQFHKEIHAFYERNPQLVDCVRFIGNIDDKCVLYQIYAKSKVFCMSSRYEGFCNSQLEALYFGLLNVSTNVSSIDDIGCNGKYAITYDTAEDLSRIIQDIVSGVVNVGERMKFAELHAEQFGIEAVVEELAKHIDPLHRQA